MTQHTYYRWLVGGTILVPCLLAGTVGVVWWTIDDAYPTTGSADRRESLSVVSGDAHILTEADESQLTLPASERSYIWQIEHRVLVLDFRFWPGLSGAIHEQDREKFHSFFAADASVELLDQTKIEEDTLGFGRVRSVTAAAGGRQTSSLEQLVLHLFHKMDEFGSDRRVSIRTVFLSPVVREHLDGEWRGRLLFRAWGRSRDQRPIEFVLEADFELTRLDENIASPAPWLKSCKVLSESFRESDQFLFAEIGKSYGLDSKRFHDNWREPEAIPRVVTGGIYAADYDLDGKTDLFVTDIKGNVLYRQVAPGRFEDATWLSKLEMIPNGAPVAWADLDGDAYPDLVANTLLYRNTGRGSFEPAGALNIGQVNYIHEFAIADYDRDGRLDIHVARGAPAPFESTGQTSWLDDRTGPGNSLLRNLGDWEFEDVTANTGTSAGTVSCLSAVWFDANDDLWPDLFVGDEFGSPVLLVNRQDGTFESRTITGDFGGFNMGVATGDLDDDGRIDLYLANMYSKAGERVLSNLNMDLYPPQLARRIRHIVDGSELWHNQGDLRFESKGRATGVARVGWAYGPLVADLDNDGRLDIYAPAGFYSKSRDEPDG